MKKLLITLMLISPFSFAGWGDVYYCQMTNFDEIMVEGEKKSWKLEKFQFKLDQTKNAMVFGNTGIFKDQVYKLTNFGNFPGLGRWYANDKYSMTYFQEGKFLYTTNGAVVGIISISADCDKF